MPGGVSNTPIRVTKDLHPVWSVWMAETHFWLYYFDFWSLTTWLPCVFSVIQLIKQKIKVVVKKVVVRVFNLRFLIKDGKRMDHHPWNVPLFLGHRFTCERIIQPCFKFYTKEGVLPIYWMVQDMLGFLGEIAIFRATPISRCFDALYRYKRRLQCRKSLFFISFDRYRLSPFPCKIWR